MSSQAKEVISVKFDFPYDLNNLFNMSYSFEILKQAIEYIAKTQAHQADMLNQLNDHYVHWNNE